MTRKNFYQPLEIQIQTHAAWRGWQVKGLHPYTDAADNWSSSSNQTSFLIVMSTAAFYLNAINTNDSDGKVKTITKYQCSYAVLSEISFRNNFIHQRSQVSDNATF